MSSDSSVVGVGTTSNTSGDTSLNVTTSGQVAQKEAVQANFAAAVDTVTAREIKVNSMEELKVKAPEIYNAFMMSFANDIRGQMQRSNDRITEELRKQRS